MKRSDDLLGGLVSCADMTHPRGSMVKQLGGSLQGIDKEAVKEIEGADRLNICT
jgi:hypothetical protein